LQKSRSPRFLSVSVDQKVPNAVRLPIPGYKLLHELIHDSIIGALEELVGKYTNGYEGPFPCKSKEVGHSPTAAHGENVQPIFTLSEYTTGDTGFSGSGEDINRVTVHNEHMHMLGITPSPTEATVDPIDAGVPSLSRTGHDIRFGESAVSPMGGSEASIQLLS
jgi:hypothetical protein